MSFFESMTRAISSPVGKAASAWGKFGLDIAGVGVPGTISDLKDAAEATAHAMKYSAEDVRAANSRAVGGTVREQLAQLEPADRQAYVDTLDRYASGDRTVSTDPGPGELAAAQLDHDLGAQLETHQAYLEAAREQAHAAQAQAEATASSEPEPDPDANASPDAEPEPEATPDPEPEPAPDPATEPTPDPVTEPTPDPEPDSTPDPVTEATPDPGAEAAGGSEPAAASGPAPEPEPSPGAE